MAQALYRKYRSKSLNEIIGQGHVTQVVAQALKNGRISHAYLLTGPRGVGKTSVARIMAHEINKLPYDGTEHLDIIEIDAASNNGVDDVRDLREKVMITPVSANKKIYIIDEVHMLSKPAFNALLKTLEEPPEHVVFILATTEVHKLPDTILSRTQRFHFRPINLRDMKEHLQMVAKKEKISLSQDALDVIAERAEGSFRDGISLLDQLSNLSGKQITGEMVEQTLGLAGQKKIKQLAQTITSRQLEAAIRLLGELEDTGVSPVVLSTQLSQELRSLIATQPSVIDVIEQLIEVGRSYNPQLKLLAIIAAAAANQATVENQPAQRVANIQASVHSIATAPPKTASSKKTQPKPAKATVAIQWPAVMQYVRETYQPLFGILKNAQAEIESDQLKLHFNFALHHKKLTEGKYRENLVDTLATLYQSVPTITITSGKISPKNHPARTVADIMGGGEEVII